jgi:hypothetical protein
MTDFAATIEAQLAGIAVSYVDLVRFDFKSGQKRVHNGFGDFLDANGEVWQGLGGLGQMSAVSAGPGQAVEEMTFALTADAASLQTLEADADEAAGREVFRYLQFCDVREVDQSGAPVKYRPLDKPFQIFWGKMGALKVERPKIDPGSQASPTRIISVSAVNAFVNRRKPAFGFFSHRDQQARSGGTDNMFINASRMADATATWPHGLS